MLIFVPLLVAYTAFWSSVLILRVPIPTPPPMLLGSTTTAPFPLLSLVSVVEGVNTIIESFPAVSDLVYSVPGARSAWYLDAPPTASPIFPSLVSLPQDLPTCVPLDWPPLSDFSHFGTGMCDQVSSTDLVIWDGSSESSNFSDASMSMITGLLPSEDVWYFVTLVASGVGFWLVCRLIAAVILKRSKVCLAEGESSEMVRYRQFGS